MAQQPWDSFLRLPEQFVPDRWLGCPALKPNNRIVLAELDGPGCIRHIWMAVTPRPGLNRQIILRIFWDDEERPSVEAPLGDFFGLCHGVPYYDINCRYLSVQGQSGMNCYFAMPFEKSARIEAETGPQGSASLFYQIDWHRYEEKHLSEPRRFHAKWRREFPAQAFGEEYTVLDAVGRGRLLGFVYGVRLYDDADRWSHGGAENIYIDGEAEPAFIRGSGGEDTFGTSYGGALHVPESHLFVGIPYYTHEDMGTSRPAQRVAAYRFFEDDAISFQHSLHFRFGCVANDLCSTAYYYQEEPHREFFWMPPWNKIMPATELRRGECDIVPEDGADWWLCGPFENADDIAMKGPLPPEEGFDPEATYNGGFRVDSPWRYKDAPADQATARWVRRREIHHFIDFNHVFRPHTRGVSKCWPAAATALTYLVLPRDAGAVLHLAWDDEISILVNGEQVVERLFHRTFRPEKVLVKLRKGINRIQIKLSNTMGTTWGAWCFAFRAVLADGTIIKPTVTPEKDDDLRLKEAT